MPDPSVDLRPCFILLNFISCAIERAACWFPCSWDCSLVPTTIILTNVSKDGDTESCWHAWENVPLNRSLLLNMSSLTISAARARDIILQSCSLSRLWQYSRDTVSKHQQHSLQPHKNSPNPFEVWCIQHHGCSVLSLLGIPSSRLYFLGKIRICSSQRCWKLMHFGLIPPYLAYITAQLYQMVTKSAANNFLFRK